ncbi:MAG: hypothetical protein ACREXT_05020 [Gammaproteobacteria bacterium]
MMAGEDKMVFAVSMDGDEPMLLLGIPQAAWEYMRGGKTHHFDLTKVGVPIKLLVFGCKDRAEAVAHIETHNRKQGLSTLYQPGKDFGIDGAKK